MANSSTYLGDSQGWREEAKAVICDVEKHVHQIFIANKLTSNSSKIYLNLTTKEKDKYTVELTAQGFRLISDAHEKDTFENVDFQEEFEIKFPDPFETPYSLLEAISPAYRVSFGKCLTEKLSQLQFDNN